MINIYQINVIQYLKTSEFSERRATSRPVMGISHYVAFACFCLRVFLLLSFLATPKNAVRPFLCGPPHNKLHFSQQVNSSARISLGENIIRHEKVCYALERTVRIIPSHPEDHRTNFGLRGSKTSTQAYLVLWHLDTFSLRKQLRKVSHLGSLEVANRLWPSQRINRPAC